MSLSKPAPPLVTMPGGPVLDDAALARSLCDASQSTCNAVNHLRNLYKALSIQHSFVHRLTEEQLWRCSLIRSPNDWASFSERFISDVHLYGVLAYDSESYRPPQGHRRDRFSVPAPARPLYALATTASGFTVIMDLEALNGGFPLGNGDAFSVLPPPFKRWMEDPSIFILGSDISSDLPPPHSVRATSLVDTRHLWRQFKAHSPNHPDQEDKLIKVYGCGNRDGLQMQAAWAKGFPYKPMPEASFIRLFGSHPYKDGNGNARWPWFRTAHLFYQWWKNVDGSIRQEHVFYMFHDSSCPISLLLRLVLERVVQVGARAVFPPDKSVAAVFRDFLQDFAYSPSGPPSTWDDEGDDDDIQVLPPPHRVNAECPGAQEDDEDDANASPPREEPPPCPANHDVSYMAYDPDPQFKRRCSACGSPSHTFMLNNRVACPLYVSEDKDSFLVCLYELCSKRRGDHNTIVCKQLHHTCQLCMCRGHYEEDDCAAWDPPQWRNNLRFWEEAADFGMYTSSRRTNWSLGFFAHRPYTPFPFPVDSYDSLIEMHPLRAQELLRSFAHGTWTPSSPVKRTAKYAYLSPEASSALKKARRRSPPQPDLEKPSPPSLFSITVACPPTLAPPGLPESSSPLGPPPRRFPSFLDRVRAATGRLRTPSDPGHSPAPRPTPETSCHSAPGLLQSQRTRSSAPMRDSGAASSGGPSDTESSLRRSPPPPSGPPRAATPSEDPYADPEPGPSGTQATGHQADRGRSSSSSSDDSYAESESSFTTRSSASPLAAFKKGGPVFLGDPEELAKVRLPPPGIKGPNDPPNGPPEYPSSSEDDDALECFLRPCDHL